MLHYHELILIRRIFSIPNGYLKFEARNIYNSMVMLLSTNKSQGLKSDTCLRKNRFRDMIY